MDEKLKKSYHMEALIWMLYEQNTWVHARSRAHLASVHSSNMSHTRQHCSAGMRCRRHWGHSEFVCCLSVWLTVAGCSGNVNKLDLRFQSFLWGAETCQAETDAGRFSRVMSCVRGVLFNTNAQQRDSMRYCPCSSHLSWHVHIYMSPLLNACVCEDMCAAG